MTIARAILTAGSSHPDVHELRRLLAENGHDTTSSTPADLAFGIVDQPLLDACAAYRAANGVEPEDAIAGVPAEQAGKWIGPKLWEAIAPVEREPETDEEREAREQREAEARRQRAHELRAELERLEA